MVQTSEFHCYCYIIRVNLATIIKFKQIIIFNYFIFEIEFHPMTSTFDNCALYHQTKTLLLQCVYTYIFFSFYYTCSYFIVVIKVLMLSLKKKNSTFVNLHKENDTSLGEYSGILIVNTVLHNT